MNLDVKYDGPTTTLASTAMRYALLSSCTASCLSLALVSGVYWFLDKQDIGISLILAGVIPLIITPILTYGYITTSLKLLESNRKLDHLSKVDDLTQAYNRRHFFELAQREFSLAQRHRHNLSLLMLDLDYFKAINDQYGHQCGDEVLIEVVKRIKTSLRETDILARYGGEEFIILLNHADQNYAQTIADRIKCSVSNTPIKVRGQQIEVSLSAGLSINPQCLASLDEAIKAADDALYQAKNKGRNRIELADNKSWAAI